jgi:hypothetical protein
MLGGTMMMKSERGRKVHLPRLFYVVFVVLCLFVFGNSNQQICVWGGAGVTRQLEFLKKFRSIFFVLLFRFCGRAGERPIVLRSIF